MPNVCGRAAPLWHSFLASVCLAPSLLLTGPRQPFLGRYHRRRSCATALGASLRKGLVSDDLHGGRRHCHRGCSPHASAYPSPSRAFGRCGAACVTSPAPVLSNFSSTRLPGRLYGRNHRRRYLARPEVRSRRLPAGRSRSASESLGIGIVFAPAIVLAGTDLGCPAATRRQSHILAVRDHGSI